MTTAVTGPHTPKHRWRRAAHVVVALLGLAMAIWGLVGMTAPQLTRITCRGVEMHPGDVCRESSYTRVAADTVQTYEQREHSIRVSRPPVVIVGLIVAGFGTALLVQDVRRGRREDDPAHPSDPED